MKKLLSLLMAVVMVASMLVPMTVSAGSEYTNGQVLFSEDFSDITKFQNLTTTPDPETGYYLVNNDHTKCTSKPNTYQAKNTTGIKSIKSENGNLVIDSNNTKSRWAARYLFYDMTDKNIDKFTVTFDFKINKFDGTSTGYNMGLIIADNGVDAPHSTEATTNAYQMFWLRHNSQTTYVSGQGLNAKDSNEQSISARWQSDASKNAGYDNTPYKLILAVDTTKSGDNGNVKLINTLTGLELYTGTFEYILTSLDTERLFNATNTTIRPQIGVILNGVDVELDQLNVYYGTREAEYTGASVSVGSDIALTYSAKINNDAVKTAGLTTKFFRDGNLVEEVEAEYKDAATATFKFDGIAPNQMDKEIVAELWSGGAKLDTRTYSVKQNLLKLIDTSDDPKVVTFAKDALVYGGAAQAYKGETDTINNGKYTSSVTTIPTPDTLNLFGTDITAAGLYFDYANKIYFKVNAGNGATVTINGTPYTAEIKDGKVYTDYIAASELGTDFTIVVTSSNGTSTLTYSVYDYIARKCADDSASDAIKNLAKALYSYAESAKLVP